MNEHDNMKKLMEAVDTVYRPVEEADRKLRPVPNSDEEYLAQIEPQALDEIMFAALEQIIEHIKNYDDMIDYEPRSTAATIMDLWLKNYEI